MSNGDKEDPKVVSLIHSEGTDNKEKLYKFDVIWNDGKEDVFEGQFLGHSSEYPVMVIILDGNKEYQFPSTILNSDQVRYIKVRDDG